jgi:hypothetical protein
MGTAVSVLDHRVMVVQIEDDDERTRTVWRRQRRRLKPAGREAQGRVLELWFGWRQRHRELAEHLGVRVQRVARVTPGVVGQIGPFHTIHFTASGGLRVDVAEKRGGGGSRSWAAAARRRATSRQATAPAAATFSDGSGPGMGMRTRRSQR